MNAVSAPPFQSRKILPDVCTPNHDHTPAPKAAVHPHTTAPTHPPTRLRPTSNPRKRHATNGSESHPYNCTFKCTGTHRP